VESNTISEFLLIGADSNLGKHYFDSLIRFENVKVTGTSYKSNSSFLKFDLNDADLPFSSPNGRGKALIFASKPNHSFCEQYPAESYEINVTRTFDMINKLNSLGWDTVVFSSAQVFSGNSPWMNVSDTPDPISTYGKQKVALENLLEICKSNLVIRVTKILNMKADPFNTWVEGLKSERIIKPFKNYPISPISVISLINGSLEIMNNSKNGVWHLGNKEQTDYYTLAKIIASENGLDSNLILFSDPHEIPMEHYPKYASLDCTFTELKTNWKAESLLESVKNSKLFK
jgi:dTDP-4-dehydrorhamnose reductase